MNNKRCLAHEYFISVLRVRYESVVLHESCERKAEGSEPLFWIYEWAVGRHRRQKRRTVRNPNGTIVCLKRDADERFLRSFALIGAPLVRKLGDWSAIRCICL